MNYLTLLKTQKSIFIPYVKLYSNMKEKTTNLILLSADNEKLFHNFTKTVLHPVKTSFLRKFGLPPELMTKTKISIWGLNPTAENERIWSDLRAGDIALFFRKGKYFLKVTVVDVARNKEIPPLLWEDERLGKQMSLLIFLENLKEINIDFDSTKQFFVDPMMPQTYSFPIKRVEDNKIDILISSFGSIENSLLILSKLKTETNQQELDIKSSDLPEKVKVEIVLGLAKIRKGQEQFRKKVLLNYRNKCAVCDIDDVELLEASHIIPVEDQKLAGSIENGLCLCVIHHTMFDKGYFSLNDNYEIILSKKKQILSILKKSIREGKQIHTPKIFPAKEFLSIHRTRFLI